MNRRTTGIALVVIGIIGLLAFPAYAGLAWYSSASSTTSTSSTSSIAQNPEPSSNPGVTGGQSPITLDEAKAIAQQYLVSLNNPNLAIKEIMEFQYNFYVMYYEKDTGIGAFEMLIWKQAPPNGMMGGSYGMGGMMGGYGAVGAIVPEPGPNMMWNTKYGMMGSRWQTSGSSQMQVSEQDAKSIAESYLSQNFPGAQVEGITRFHGYYTIDFEKDSEIIGMLSVNGYTGNVWHHSWHGTFIQEIELD